MTRTLTFEERYPTGPDRLFELVTDLDTLEAVTKPWVQFHHLPSGQVRQGQVLDVALSVLGVFPVRPYRMRIVTCDPTTRRMRSEEDGAGVRRLTHDLEVFGDPQGARLVDRVEIDAGWMTPVAVAFAWITYRWRHHLRMRLLKAGKTEG